MAKPNDSRGRRKLLEGAAQKVKTPSASRAGLPGYGGDSIALHAKKPQTISKLNTPTKRSAPPSVTPPTSGLGARKDASHVLTSAGKQSSSAGAVADPYDFPVDDAEDAAAQQRVPASSTGAEKHKMRTSGGRLGGLYQGSLGRGDINASNTSRQLFNEHPNGKSSSGLSARQAAGQVTAAAGFTTAATVPSACAGGSAAGGSSSMVGRAKQTGIRSFTVPQHSLLGSPTTYAGKLPAGMVNHGNTCYLNAVLQALLSLPCLAQDLTSDQLQQLHLPAECVTYALRECLQQYTTSCTGAGSERSGCAISPAVVSAAMARLSPRWGGCRQEDAHEFLTALLDAMQTEVLALQHQQLMGLKGPPGTGSSTPTSSAAAAFAASDAVMQDAVVPAADVLLDQLPGCRLVLNDQQLSGLAAAAAGDATLEGAAGLVVDAEAADGGEAAGGTGAAASADMAPATPAPPSLRVSVVRCPASRNFSGCLQHTLICSACNHVSTVKEQFNHLSVDLPVPPGSGTADGGSASGSPAAGQQQQAGEVDWMLSGGLNSKAAGAVSGITGAAAGGSIEQYVPDLQSLLANFFAPEVLDKSCEACGAASAQHRLEHAVRRLPRVLVVHLKRFQWQVLAGGGAICRKLSTQVRPDQQLQLGPVCCPGRPVPALLAELMPPGLLQAAHAACADPDSSKDCGEAAAKQQGLAGSSKAAAGLVGTTGHDVGSNGLLAGSKRSRSEADASATPLTVDGELGAAAGRNGSKQQQQQPPQKQHRQQDLKAAWGSVGAVAAAGGDGPAGYGTQPKPVQHGASRLSRMHAVQDQQEQQRQPCTKTVLTRPFDGSTFSRVTATGGRHTYFTQQVEDAVMGDTGPGLQRNNSSTHVLDLAAAEDEDADLQKALALSLQTAAQEQADRDDPAMLIGRRGDDPLALVQVASMPDWMAGGAAAAAAADPGSGSPKTPKAPTLIAGRQPLQPLKVGTTVKADDLFHWAPQDAGTAAAAAGGVSGGQGSGPVSGDAGLSGGLAFSDGGAASGGPAAQQQGGGTNQFIGATPPNSPPTRVQETSTQGNSNNSSGVNWADKGSKLLEGIENMSEEEQMRRAVEQSLLDQGGSAAAGGGAGELGLGVADTAGYDYDAALAKALAESAAEQERVLLAAQQQQQQGETADDQQQQGAGEAGTAAAAGEQQQGTSSGGNGAAGAAAAGDDNAVVVVEGEGADGSAADRQHQQRPRWPLVRLVEDSDCEEDDSTHQPEQQLQQIASAPATAAAIPGEAAAPDAMQVDLQEVVPAAAGSLNNGITAATAIAAVSQQRQQQQHAGKENREDQHAAVSSAAASKPKQFKRARRPLGELLVDREAAKANRHNPPGSAAAAAANASDPPVKGPAVAAAVAAAEAAAAAAAGGSSCKGDELAATDAAAAAEVAGTWPQENAALYQLRAVVRHKGPLASSGHFVSDVMNNQQGGQWFHYDDSFVQPTRLEAVTRRCETDGYLFFYVNTAISGQQPACKKQL